MSDIVIPEGDYVEIVNRYVSILLVVILLTSKGVQD